MNSEVIFAIIVGLIITVAILGAFFIGIKSIREVSEER